MADNRMTKKRIMDHWRYSWFKYALLLIVTLLGVDLLFAVTAYRPSEDRRLQVYLCNGYADATALSQDLWDELKAACPEQEQLIVQNIDLTGGDMNARIQFSTYIAVHEGDVCLLPAAEAYALAEESAELVFVELTPYIESGIIVADGIDLTRGEMDASDGTRGLYAIPADMLTGLGDYGCDPSGGMLVAMAYGGNDETAVTLIGQMLERFRLDSGAHMLYD